MKYLLLAWLCLLTFDITFAAILNGYEPDVAAARFCLNSLNRRLLLSPDMSDGERRKINTAIRKHTLLLAHYQLTEVLLAEFRQISPQMFEEMERLTDKRGRVTDIYVRFIPQEDATTPLAGASFFQVSTGDEDANFSRYGDLTVAIDVWISDAALNVLAHELGHTRFIVPNLARYRSYYRKTYAHTRLPANIGHNASDESGKMAYQFGHRFLRDRRSYRQSTGHLPRPVSLVFRDVKRNVHDVMVHQFEESIASRNFK